MSIDVQPDVHVLDEPTKPKFVHKTSHRKPTQPSSSWLIRSVIALGAIAMVAAVFWAMLNGDSARKPSTALTHKIAKGDLVVSVTEDGTLESSNNTEIKCRVKGGSTVLWVIESGTQVKPGDILVRLDQSTIEDTINQQKITYQNALATYAQSESNVAVAEISITEYLEGTFRTEMKTAQSNVAISEENLRVAQNVLNHAKKMFRKGYVSELELDSNQYSVEHARLELELMKTQVDALEKFTKPKMLKELQSTLKANKAKMASDKAALDLEKARLERAEQQLKNCTITAENSGMVIYPSAAEWKEQPDIEEGANVREDQVLLIIPDLENMQVKVGVHESKIDRMEVGMPARIELQDQTVDGEVESIASITRPAGWWTGNAVKYDTMIKLGSPKGLKPGMSAAVEIFMAKHNDVLIIPVAAVVELEQGHFSWIQTDQGVEKRKLDLGDSNDQFIVVKDGLHEGEDVILNPLAYVEEAQSEAKKPGNQKPKEEAPDVSAKDATVGTKNEKKKVPNQSATQIQMTGAAILKMADKNKDGVLTKDEYSEKDRDRFESTDLNGDSKVDEAELDAALKKLKDAAGNKLPKDEA